MLTDCRFWLESGRARNLFWGHGIGLWRGLYPPQIAPALHHLERIWFSPHLVEDALMADACSAIWDWAEQREHLEIALQFAELAARLAPDRSDRASTAGRLCRRVGDRARGTMWFNRGLKQAVRTGNLIDKATARLGWSALEREMDRLRDAEHHGVKAFRAAMRAGRRSLAASAAHELMACYITQERWEEAMGQAQSAVAMYKTEHPRLVALAHDVAVLWLRRGYASSALAVLEVTASLVRRPAERDTVLANLARAAGACGARLQYDRALASMMSRLESGEAVSGWAIYHLAHAARNAGDWDVAEKLARLATTKLPGAHRKKAKNLLVEIAMRAAGDSNLTPSEGSEIDKSRETLLKKLKKNAAANPDMTAPPEIYPLS